MSTHLQINEFLSLKLENDVTNVYINDEKILVCKHIAINLKLDELDELEEVSSIDYLAEKYENTINEDYKRLISPKDEFFVHCSNIQSWAEHGYDTRLLHSNIAFPLLKELAEVGDAQARRIFKEEIVKRYCSGSKKVQHYLASEGYLNLLTDTEREHIFSEGDYNVVTNIEKIINKRLEFVGNINLNPGIEVYDGKVEGLRMQCLRSIIPPQIRNLKSLKKLILVSFKDKTLPDWIKELSELKLLNLHSNDLEKLPTGIGDLLKLEHLNLSNNKISSLPDEMGNLVNLKKLYLSNNELKEFPNQLHNLESLRRLSVRGNHFTEIPDKILKKKGLEII